MEILVVVAVVIALVALVAEAGGGKGPRALTDAELVASIRAEGEWIARY